MNNQFLNCIYLIPYFIIIAHEFDKHITAFPLTVEPSEDNIYLVISHYYELFYTTGYCPIEPIPFQNIVGSFH